MFFQKSKKLFYNSPQPSNLENAGIVRGEHFTPVVKDIESLGLFVNGLLNTTEQFYGQISKITSGNINIQTAGTYQSTGLVGTLDSLNKGISLGTTNTFALKNVSNKNLLLKFYASADVQGGNNKVLGIILARNGVPIPETECQAPTGVGTTFAKLITSWMILVNPNDEISLFVTNFTNTGNITLLRARLIANT
jgi:hypothetical protein